MPSDPPAQPAIRTTAARDAFWWVLIVVPPLLIFPRLGCTYLWQDEAETALLARCVLRHGYPLANDGRHVISDQPGRADLNDHGVWIWTPWLQHYVAAASFAVLGESTFAARLPFALAGWGVFFVTYGAFREITSDRRLARWALVILMTSVPFLLHTRQCRYYSLFTLFTVLHAWGYLRLTRSVRGGAWRFVLGGIGLYHTFFPQLVASMLGVAIHALLYHRRRPLLQRLGALAVVVAVFSVPFFVYTQAWSRDYEGLGYGFDGVLRYLASLRAYLLHLHLWCVPFLLLVPLALRRRQRRRRIGAALAVVAAAWVGAVSALPTAATLWASMLLASTAVILGIALTTGRNPATTAPGDAWRPLVVLIIAVSVLLFAGLAPFPFFRYLVGILPFTALAAAALILSLAGKRIWLAGVLMIATVAVEVLPYGPFRLATCLLPQEPAPGSTTFLAAGHPPTNGVVYRMLNRPRHRWKLRCPPADYLEELTHEYVGPIKGVARYLNKHAGPGDTVSTVWEHFPLMFHTRLRVARNREVTSLPSPPEWVFFRRTRGGEQFPEAWMASHQAEYERVGVDAHELPWENIPEPHLHRFVTPKDRPMVDLRRHR